LTGGVQENATDVEVVLAVVSIKFVGGYGTVGRDIVRENVKLLF
jgi:hypothetical protein